MIEFLLNIQFFSLLEFALVASLWFPFRKTPYVAALPWILASWFIGSLAGVFVGPTLVSEINATTRSLLPDDKSVFWLSSWYAMSMFLCSKIKELLLIFMLCVNGAFLLRECGQSKTRFLLRLADWQSKQTMMGIVLLILTFASLLISAGFLAYLKMR